MEKKDDKFLYIFLSLIYFIAILPKTVQMAFIILFLAICIMHKKKIFIDKKSIPFLIVFIIQIFAIVFYAMNNDSSRIVAAINTAVLWLIGPLLYSFIINLNISKEKIEKICYINIMITIVLALLMIVMTKIGSNGISILGRDLMRTDWLNNKKDIRLLGFLEYSNLIVLLFFLIHPFALRYVCDNKRKIFQILFMILSIIPVFLTNSRIGIILSLIYYCFVIPKIISFNKKTFILTFVLFILIGGTFVLINHEMVANKISEIVHSRENSSTMRNIIYSKSIEKTMNDSPIIGVGVKEYIGEYPLGSHSTIIGFLYKTGILGLIFGILGFFLIIKDYFKKHNLLFFISFCCLTISLFFEDLDGANWFIILFFIITSYYCNLYEVKDNV